jgi:mRNA-degrading endonuclease RelE of RelBE toxin-antitoxin system
MKWDLIVANPARRAIHDMPLGDGEQIIEALEELRVDQYIGDVKFLKGTDRAPRRRVGAWRIMFEVLTERRIVVVRDVERRGSNTY